MKTLILFSLKRRFFNKISILLEVLFVCIIVVCFNADRFIQALNIKLYQPISMYVSEETRQLLLDESYFNQAGFIFSYEKQTTQLIYQDNQYFVYGLSNGVSRSKLYTLLLKSHQTIILNTSHPSVEAFIANFNTIQVSYDSEINDIDALKQTILFMLITSVYFMMLNFISVNSNEIIMEKSTNVLETILCSVSSFKHFMAKIILGALTVMIQLLTGLAMITLVLFQRYQYDQGKGLLEFIFRYLNLPFDSMSFSDLLSLLKWNSNEIMLLAQCLLFLFIGLLIIQVLILMMSSKVKTIEEASSIQGPFYLVLLALYYLALSLNTPEQISNGLGYILSYVPIASMLTMGMRILNTRVLMSDLLFSLSLSLTFLAGCMYFGFPYYKKGLMNEK
jgi:ABC-2 type transport system permease protein